MVKRQAASFQIENARLSGFKQYATSNCIHIKYEREKIMRKNIHQFY